MQNEIPEDRESLGPEPTEIRALDNEVMVWDEKTGSWVITGGNGVIDCFFYAQFEDGKEDE